MSFELGVQFLYIPDYDFDEIVKYALKKYQNESIECDTEKCWFENKCENVDLKGLSIKLSLYYHHMGNDEVFVIGENVLKINGGKIGLSDDKCVLNVFKSNLKAAKDSNKYIIGTWIM